MNCEVCEYDVILNDYEHVKKFEELLFQYHAYIAKMSAQLLLKKLSDDFLCSMLTDERFYRRYGGNKKYHGLIKCIRK
jgi:hypothetical protein